MMLPDSGIVFLAKAFGERAAPADNSAILRKNCLRECFICVIR